MMEQMRLPGFEWTEDDPGTSRESRRRRVSRTGPAYCGGCINKPEVCGETECPVWPLRPLGRRRNSRGESMRGR